MAYSSTEAVKERHRRYSAARAKTDEGKQATARYQMTARGRAVRLVISARTNAKKKGLAFDLDTAWVEAKIKGGCERTGLPFELVSGEANRSGWHRVGDMSPSLDKKDPLGGYTKYNVQVVVWMYNRAKGCNTDAAVLEFAKALVRANGGSLV